MKSQTLSSSETVSPRGSPLTRLGLLAVLLLILAVYYWPWLSGSAQFWWLDHGQFFQPYCHYIGTRLAQGQLPLWNPMSGLGQSQLAVVSPGIFYPPDWLFAALPYSNAVALLMIFHQAVAAVGAYLLCRAAKLPTTAAVIAAIGTGLNGYMFGLTQNWTLVAGAAWLPLILYFQGTLVDGTWRQRKVAFVGLAVCTFLEIASGRPEIFVMTLLIDVVYLAYLCRRSITANRSWNLIWQAIAALCLGILLAMPVILPAVEWAQLSPRNVGPGGASDALDWSAGVWDILSIALGQPLGPLLPQPSLLTPLTFTMKSYLPLMGNCYLGPVLLTLAALGLLLSRHTVLKWSLLVSAILISTLALGSNTPLMPWLISHISFIHFARFPIKLMFFVDWCLTMLAALGIATLSDESVHSSRRWKHASVVLTAAWVAIVVPAVLLLMDPHSTMLPLHSDFSTKLNATLADVAVHRIAVWMAYTGLMGLLSSALIWYGHRWTKHCSTALCLLATASILAVSWLYSRPLGGAKFYQQPSFCAEVVTAKHLPQEGPRARINSQILLPPALPMSYHAPGSAVDQFALSTYERQTLDNDTPLDFGISHFWPYEGSITSNINKLDAATRAQGTQMTGGAGTDIPLARACQMSATTFVISQLGYGERKLPLLDPHYFDLIAERAELNVRIFRTRDSLPYAYLIDNWLWVDKTSRVLNTIAQAHTSGFDPHAVVLLTGSGQSCLKHSVDVQPASWNVVSPEHIIIHAQPKNRSVLIVADKNYPGWSATIDGVDAPIYEANGLFKAVFLEPGAHEVVLCFRPKTLLIGGVLAFIAVLLIIVQAAGFAQRAKQDRLP